MNVRELYATITGCRRLVETELNTQPAYSASLRRRLWLWRRGFLSKSGVVYDLHDADYRDYLTDYQRYVRSKRINGSWSITLSNKLIFHWLMRPFDDHRMAVYGLLRDGHFHAVDSLQASQDRTIADGGGTGVMETVRSLNRGGSLRRSLPAGSDAVAWVTERLEDEESLVLKWVQGGGGNNVLLCSRAADGDGYRVNGEWKSVAAFESLVRDLEDYLVCEFVEQGPRSAALYPETPNSLRIITMYDAAAGEPFVAAAIQRIGTDDSFPMDNFSQGGLSAAIDRETGTLGPGVQVPAEGSLEWFETHPDTGAQIDGVAIPGWSSIEETILELAGSHSYVPYVGWDVIVTDDGGAFTVIEGNSYPGLKSIQVHGPLLADDRVRRFYERHGVC